MGTSDNVAGLREQIIDNAAVLLSNDRELRVVLTTEYDPPACMGLTDIFKGYRAHLVQCRDETVIVAAGGLKEDVKAALESLMDVMARVLAMRDPNALEEIPEQRVKGVGDGVVDKGMLFPGI